ncbi:MAG: alpha/beta family hydrolase [Myxococcota bacterium]
MRQEERAVTIALPGGPGDLEGLYVSGQPPEDGGSVIAPPHPLYGGSMESPVVSELAHACARAGLASLRFNWRGVGASAGAASGDAGPADADYSAALAHQAETVTGELVAAGYSFGACSAVRASQSVARVRRLLLVSPVPALLDDEALRAFPGSVLVVAGEADDLAPAAALCELAREGSRTRLHVIPEADHFFLSGLAELGRTAREWLSR